ncbi:NAD-dependent epimerase/dehydratase family protein [Chryseobacterium camelliae]|uniref:NAD-dependent epimerase/dehydratase family protein n=1 Tax=Chryseobacterium camelliae TaxID=1265445 RepID=UPI00286574DE|nr:NAD-dependent epimerase/dehydratase family protein [Chryseobacterium camelliae]MDR6516365.1 nucleoside-diphosphate-sugar epimerase [Chryseobacterium camelliae]
MVKKIIITGSSGFIGKNLSVFLKDNGFTIDMLNLRDKDWKKHINIDGDAVIHLAGKAHDTENTSETEEYFRVNTDLTIELFNEFLRSGSRDFFYFSSVKAVADNVEGILDENTTPNPLTPYGKSKLKAEQYVLDADLPAGKRVFIIRPCMVHGPGNKGNLNLLYKIVEKSIPWPLAAFENKRSFLNIDNLNFIIAAILKQKDIPSGVYNVADDNSLSTNELIQTVNLALGKKPKLWKISKSIIENMAGIGDRLRLPLNSERLKKLTESYVVSNQKIKSALGIEKLPLSAEEGLIKTIKSFKEKK